MFQKLYCFLAGILLLVFSATAFSQENYDNNVQVRLSLSDGKTIYRMGEPIRLVLTFTAKSGRYNLLMSSEKMVSSPDEVFLSPGKGAFAWAAQNERGKYFMNDYFGYGELSEKPIDIYLALNDFFRFDKPGRYSVYIKTKRVFTPKGKSQFEGDLISLVSNPVEFEVKEMSDAEEREEIKRLGALIDSRKDWREQNKYVQALSFLAGDAATVEKVNRFLNPGDYQGNYQSHIRTGLLIARNKALAIKLLEDALRDPTREVEYNLSYMLAELRWLEEDNFSRSNGETDFKILNERRDKRFSEITREYFDEMFRSLPNRTGKSRLVTAYTVFTQLPKEDVSSNVFNATKAILLENFDDLTPYGKERLLDYYWEKIKTPALLPSIEKILSGGEPVSYWSYRNLPLKRLIEFDQTKARPIVIDEIRNPDSRISFEVLSSLDDKFLPEIDSSLLEQIQKLSTTNDHRLNQKILLAARYATGAIYQGLMEIYKTRGNHWSEETKNLLLGYFIRHNEEAISLIEERLAKSGDNSGGSIFFNITKINFPEFPKSLEKLLRKRLEGDDPSPAGTASYYLSRYGDEKNKKLIEERYRRWLKEWRDRAAELNNPNADAAIKNQAMFEINVVESLIGAKNWKLSVLETKQLKSMCVTQTCRQRFSIQ